MYSNVNELLKNEITPDFQRQIYYGVQNGTVIFKELLGDNIELFGNSLSSNVLPKIMNFCINRQFSPEIYISKNGFVSYVKKVNSFGQKIVVLENENLILHVAKVQRGNKLPSEAKYKKALAQNNTFEDGQLQMDLWNKDSNKINVLSNYGIISYSLTKDFNVESIFLVIPNTTCDGYIGDIDIMAEVEKIKSVDTDKQNEKTLITLKEKVKEDIKGQQEKKLVELK